MSMNMKKTSFYIGTAVLAFSISLAGVFVFGFLSQFPRVEVADENSYSVAPVSLNYEIEVQYLFTIQSKTGNRGNFRVTNNSNESVYYVSYAKNEHADNWIKQNNKLTTDLICHMGMQEHEIKPNESMTFNVSVPKNKKPFEAGFMFYIGEGRNSFTIWRSINSQSLLKNLLINLYINLT